MGKRRNCTNTEHVGDELQNLGNSRAKPSPRQNEQRCLLINFGESQGTTTFLSAYVHRGPKIWTAKEKIPRQSSIGKLGGIFGRGDILVGL
jgi:hypothetical protein